MSKKKSTLLKPGDIVRQGRQRHELRVLQANGDRAVLVETVNNEASEYAAFYAPAADLKLVESTKPAEDDKPPATEQPYDVVYVPADARADERVTINVEAVDEDAAIAKVNDLVEVAEIVSVEKIVTPA